MARIIPAAFAALRAVFLSACPALADTGIYEAEHANTIPWEDFDLPYGVILMEEMGPADWGANNHYRVPVKFYYLDHVDGPVRNIRDVLEDLRDTLATWDQTQLYSIEKTTRLDWSSSLDVNIVLMSKNISGRAGMLQIDCLFGA